MGKPSHVVGTASPKGTMVHLSGTSLTLLHQAATQPGVFDRLSIWATNLHSTDSKHVDIFWAADTDPDCKIPVDLAANAGPIRIATEWPLERGLTVKAQATTGATVNMTTVVEPVSSFQ